jgi:tRNA(Ile)-lysidine synthase
MMAQWARAEGLDAVALGHTMDDQAETVLMRLAREAGVDGLSGMAPEIVRHGMRFCRPVLTVRREALRDVLRARRVRWAEDPSNEDPAFERVRARQALAGLGPVGISVEQIAGSARHLREARDALAQVAADFAREKVKSVAGDLIFDRTLLNRQPAEIRRRLLVGALKWVASADYPPRRESLADLDAAIARGENATLHGCRIMVSGFTLRVTREAKAVDGLSSATDAAWDERWRLDGPHAPDLEIRALGEAVKDCPDWRETRLPRSTLLASPAVWRGEALVAAPVAGLSNGWVARVTDQGDFAASLISH